MSNSERSHDKVLDHNLRFITDDRKRNRELFLLILFELSFWRPMSSALSNG